MTSQSFEESSRMFGKFSANSVKLQKSSYLELQNNTWLPKGNGNELVMNLYSAFSIDIFKCALQASDLWVRSDISIYWWYMLFIQVKIIHTGKVYLLLFNVISIFTLRINSISSLAYPRFLLPTLTLISYDSEALEECGQVYHIWNFYQATEEIQSSDPFHHLSYPMGSHKTSLPGNSILD